MIRKAILLWQSVRSKHKHLAALLEFVLVFALLFMRISTIQGQGLDTLKAISTLNGHRMPFAILKTKADTNGAVSGIPVILFLHGAGERGNDNALQLTVGLPKMIKTLDSLHTKQYIIVVPQCGLAEKWVDSDWTALRDSMKRNMTSVLANVMHVFDSIVASTPLVDTNCLYVTGISMGGFGTWELVQRFPDRFAAAIPICGGGDLAQVSRMVKTPIWAIHGQKDKLVKVSRTTEMVEAIHHAGGNVRESIYQDLGHLCWNRAYQSLDLIQWFLSYHRNDR